MTHNKHTPGPWYLHDGLNGYEIHGKKLIIAHITTEPNAVSEDANANLIAAAPDLLDALEEIRDLLWSRPDISDRLRPLMGFAEEATNQKAAAAIAKARGQSPRV